MKHDVSATPQGPGQSSELPRTPAAGYAAQPLGDVTAIEPARALHGPQLDQLDRYAAPIGARVKHDRPDNDPDVLPL